MSMNLILDSEEKKNRISKDINKIVQSMQIPSTSQQQFYKSQRISCIEKGIPQLSQASLRIIHDDFQRLCQNNFKPQTHEIISQDQPLHAPQFSQYQNINLHQAEYALDIEIRPEDVAFIIEEVVIPSGKLVYRGAKNIVSGVGKFVGWLFQKKKEENVSQSNKSNEISNVKQTNNRNQTSKASPFKSNEEVSKILIDCVKETNKGGFCTRAVMNALKGRALNSKGCGFDNPQEAEKEFIIQKYNKVEKGVQPRVGTIRIFRPIEGHSVGHIQVYCKDDKKYKDGVWISDFVQNNADVYGKKSDYQDYYKETQEDKK